MICDAVPIDYEGLVLIVHASEAEEWYEHIGWLAMYHGYYGA